MPSTYKQSFKQNYTDNVELSIFNCGLQSCERGYTWGPGVRDHYLIHYVVDGKGTYTVNNTVYELRAGDIFLAKPSQLITYSADKEEPWEYYWVGFNGACANKLVLQLPFREDMPTHHCKNAERVKKALFNIFLSRGPEPRNETLMVGYLYLFIAELMQEAMDLEPHASNSSSQYVINAIKYIQFNYSHDISIDDIAKAVGVSRSHLYRVFMSNVGQSPIDYLTSYRISEACFLLKNSQLSIAEIAVSVGFFDQFYFSRVFKKSKGVPPSKYLTCGLPYFRPVRRLLFPAPFLRSRACGKARLRGRRPAPHRRAGCARAGHPSLSTDRALPEQGAVSSVSRWRRQCSSWLLCEPQPSAAALRGLSAPARTAEPNRRDAVRASDAISYLRL